MLKWEFKEGGRKSERKWEMERDREKRRVVKIDADLKYYLTVFNYMIQFNYINATPEQECQLFDYFALTGSSCSILEKKSSTSSLQKRKQHFAGGNSCDE